MPALRKEKGAARQKKGPRFHGGRVALVLSLCESFFWRPYGGVAAGWYLASRGEDNREITAVPCQSEELRFGVTQVLGRQTVFHHLHMNAPGPYVHGLGVGVVFDATSTLPRARACMR